tara:strand:- start:323 stop:664 length:342 start_codon:yes stop_codon:yes gene_type:complete
MSRFLPGTDPEYIKQVNKQLGHTADTPEGRCKAQMMTMKFASKQDSEKWLANCIAQDQDDTEVTSSVLDTEKEVEDNVVTAGFGKNNKLIIYLLIAGGLYYAYTQGLFKKIIK